MYFPCWLLILVVCVSNSHQHWGLLIPFPCSLSGLRNIWMFPFCYVWEKTFSLWLEPVSFYSRQYADLCSSAQPEGAVWGGGLRDQPHPSGLLCIAAGVRTPEGTSSLQLCRSLPQIQADLSLQRLSPRPGGAVQRLSIMVGHVKERCRGEYLWIVKEL